MESINEEIEISGGVPDGLEGIEKIFPEIYQLNSHLETWIFCGVRRTIKYEGTEPILYIVFDLGIEESEDCATFTYAVNTNNESISLSFVSGNTDKIGCNEAVDCSLLSGQFLEILGLELKQNK